MNCDCKKYLWFGAGVLIGGAVVAAILGNWVWLSVGAIPLFGKAIQWQMKKRAKGVVDFNSNGTQKKAERPTFRPGHH